MNMKNYNTVELIRLFNCVVAGNTASNIQYKNVATKAIQRGYIVTPDAVCPTVVEFLDTIPVNYNSTFYKNWEDVTSKSRLELFIDQIFHYASTYGTDFSCGNGYVPNDGEGADMVFAFDNYKVISAVTAQEMFDKCMTLGASGIALKGESVETLGEFIINYALDYQVSVDVDSLKNRELRTKIYDGLGLYPTDKFELIRYFAYKATGKSMIINNERFLNEVRNGAYKVDFNALNEHQIDALASVFYRYKKFILMFKNHYNNHVINVIRRKAVKLHKPMKVGYWESLLSTPHTFDEVYEKSAELTNYKIVTLMQMLNEETLITEGSKKMYVIRNGKTFVKDATPKDAKQLRVMYNALRARLVNNLSKKACTIKLPDTLQIACPTSEKNFVAGIPFGSYFTMTEHNVIGIYWRNEWGTHDFDLSMNATGGRRFGWISDYYNGQKNIVYSGDMTNAEPEATELFYVANGCPDGTFYVNRYNGKEGSQFRFFFANECLNPDYMRNHMVNPANIKLSVMMTSDTCQQKIGFVQDDRFYFMDQQEGNSIVARTRGCSQEDMLDIFRRKGMSYVYLNDILLDAGFTIAGEDETPELDLTDLAGDTLITLFDNSNTDK